MNFFHIWNGVEAKWYRWKPVATDTAAALLLLLVEQNRYHFRVMDGCLGGVDEYIEFLSPCIYPLTQSSVVYLTVSPVVRSMSKDSRGRSTLPTIAFRRATTIIIRLKEMTVADVDSLVDSCVWSLWCALLAIIDMQIGHVRGTAYNYRNAFIYRFLIMR